ncbi:MAG: hypothetical protein ABR534_14725 [Desulfotignum sp.]|nr:hypothetical protein [Desulfobacteraceae bacterium]
MLCQKRFLLGMLGIAFIPLPVLGTTISSAIQQIHMADAVTRTRIMNSLFWELLFISLDLIVIACIVAYLLAKAVSVPLEHIRTAIQSVENNDLDTRVPILLNLKQEGKIRTARAQCQCEARQVRQKRLFYKFG